MWYLESTCLRAREVCGWRALVSHHNHESSYGRSASILAQPDHLEAICKSGHETQDNDFAWTEDTVCLKTRFALLVAV